MAEMELTFERGEGRGCELCNPSESRHGRECKGVEVRSSLQLPALFVCAPCVMALAGLAQPTDAHSVRRVCLRMGAAHA